MVDEGDASGAPNAGLYYPSGNWIAAIYERGYPFEIWDERIAGLDVPDPSPLHFYGVAEALLVLTDTYATTLTASLMNPSFRWLAVERFASPQKVAFVAKLLGTESIEVAHDKLMQDPGFIKLRAVAADVQDKTTVMSILLGNPAERDPRGTLLVKYDPARLAKLASAALRFGRANRRILNAVKHGYRLPMYKPEELDLVVAGIRRPSRHSGQVQDPCELRSQIERSGLRPVFWLLQTPESRDRDPSRSPPTMEATVTLYGIRYRLALEHLRLLLDLLGLLFDRRRSGSMFKQSAEAIGDSPFESVLSSICWMPIPMHRADEEEARTVQLLVPNNRKRQPAEDG